MRASTLFRIGFGRAAEGVISVAAVLLCFGAFLGLLSIVFPSGAGLDDLLRGGAGPTTLAAMSPGQQSLVSEGLNGNSMAVLSQARHEVKARRGNSLAWQSAASGMALDADDAVQTFRHSSALISFDKQNDITLGPNSLIVLQDLNRGLLQSGSRSRMSVKEGELRGRVSGGVMGQDVEVVLPNGSARVASGAGRPPADFRILVNPDHSSTVVVERGLAEVTAGGVTVRVSDAQFTRVPATGAPSAPRGLLPAPRLLSPAAGESFSFRELRPVVRFRWSSVPEVTTYRLLVAVDAKFQNLVVDETMTETEFVHANLKAGRYYWQVAGLCDGGECTHRLSGSFNVLRDVGPPILAVRFPDGPVEGSEMTLEGTAERGVRVFVRGEEVAVDAGGRFALRLSLEPGLNVVVVEAVDKTGNVAYRSKIVNAKYENPR